MSIGARFAIIYAALFMGAGTFLPYFPPWLESRGLSAAEIGLALGLTGLLRSFTMPLVAYAADRTGRPVAVLRWLTGAAALVQLAYLWTDSFWPILAVLGVMTVIGPPILPMTEGLAMRVSAAGGMDYGRVRLWGSLAFIAANLGIGALLGALGPDVVVVVLSLSAGIQAWGYVTLREAALRTAPAGAGEAGVPSLAGVVRLVRAPAFLAFALAAGFGQASHAVYYAFGTLHWQAQGLDPLFIGALWALGVAAEVVLFWGAAGVVRRVPPAWLIGLGGAGAILRWGVLAFDPPAWALPGLQLLHAATFGLTHLGAMQFLVRAVPPGLTSTAQAVHAALASGVLMAGATMAAGVVYAGFGGLAYLAMAGLGVLACAAAAVGARCWKGAVIDV